MCTFCFRILVIVTLLVSSRSWAEERHAIAKIGLILPLSGEWAFLGEGIRDAARLAQLDLRAQGINLDLAVEDNRGEVAQSVGLGKKLVQVDKVDALISIISGVAGVLKPIAERAEVLNIGICSDTSVADGKRSFINYLTAEQGVEAFLGRIGSRTKLGIYAMREAGFQRIRDELRTRIPEGQQILFEESFSPGENDFRPILLRHANARPDLLLVLGLSPSIENLVNQARSLGITTELASIESFGLANDKRPFEGAWFVDSAVPDLSFRSRFLEVYGREVTPGVGHAYDSVRMIAQAFSGVSAASDLDRRREAQRRFLRIDQFPGVIGPLRVRSDGIIWSEASIKRIRKGVIEIE